MRGLLASAKKRIEYEDGSVQIFTRRLMHDGREILSVIHKEGARSTILSSEPRSCVLSVNDWIDFQRSEEFETEVYL